MQSNVELGLQAEKVTFVGTLGTQEGPSSTPHKGEFLSERHYLLWETSEDTRLRTGKFRLNYGLYDANHNRVVKSPLGFGPNSETYNLEFFKFSDAWELFLTAGLGRLDLPRDPTSERNLSTTFARYVSGKGKIGGSLLFGESTQQRRTLGGIFSVLPLLEKGILKIEADYQKSSASATPETSSELFAAYISTGYSLTKGVQPYLFFEYLQRDLADSKSAQNSPGLGIQWLPLPHFELQAEFKRQILNTSPESPDYSGWAVIHFYL